MAGLGETIVVHGSRRIFDGEGVPNRKVSEKWIRKTKCGALGVFCNSRQGHGIQNLAGALQTMAVRGNLSVGEKVKMEISDHWPRLKLPSAISALEAGSSM